MQGAWRRWMFLESETSDNTAGDIPHAIKWGGENHVRPRARDRPMTAPTRPYTLWAVTHPELFVRIEVPARSHEEAQRVALSACGHRHRRSSVAFGDGAAGLGPVANPD